MSMTPAPPPLLPPLPLPLPTGLILSSESRKSISGALSFCPGRGVAENDDRAATLSKESASSRMGSRSAGCTLCLLRRKGRDVRSRARTRMRRRTTTSWESVRVRVSECSLETVRRSHGR